MTYCENFIGANYAYDLDGNLISDNSEDIAAIHWNASGKVTRVERTSASPKHDLRFLYDALGNRYGKVSSVGDAPISEADITMYIRDAQGNPLEIYDYSFEDLGDNEYRESLKLNERILYGSSRLGTEVGINEEVAFAEFSVSSGDYPYDGNPFSKQGVSTTLVEPDAKKFSLIRGRKHFELTNHLGNVLATVSDKRIPIDGKYSWVLGAAGTGDYNFIDGAFVYDAGNGNYSQDEAPDGTIDFYMPKVTMANRYYPFGMVQPNPDNISGSTRYGFNGMERDGEVTSGSYTTPFRELDVRLGGRWWSRDPIVKPWESPYAGFANNPIYYSDPSGLDPKPKWKKPKGKKAKKVKVDGATTDKGPGLGQRIRWGLSDMARYIDVASRGGRHGHRRTIPQTYLATVQSRQQTVTFGGNANDPEQAPAYNPVINPNPVHSKTDPDDGSLIRLDPFLETPLDWDVSISDMTDDPMGGQPVSFSGVRFSYNAMAGSDPEFYGDDFNLRSNRSLNIRRSHGGNDERSLYRPLLSRPTAISVSVTNRRGSDWFRVRLQFHFKSWRRYSPITRPNWHYKWYRFD